MKAIEEKREARIIRSSLEAKLVLSISDSSLFSLLKVYEKDLASFFIVSEVQLEAVCPQAGKLGKGKEPCTRDTVQENEIDVAVMKAEGGKCQRCWNYSASVGASTIHPFLCNRCVEVLEKIDPVPRGVQGKGG